LIKSLKSKASNYLSTFSTSLQLEISEQLSTLNG
jgi:hypothetical protein